MTTTRSRVIVIRAALACCAVIILIASPSAIGMVLQDSKLKLLLILCLVAAAVYLLPQPEVKEAHKETDHIGWVMLALLMVAVFLYSMALWPLFDHTGMQSIRLL